MSKRMRNALFMSSGPAIGVILAMWSQISRGFISPLAALLMFILLWAVAFPIAYRAFRSLDGDQRA